MAEAEAPRDPGIVWKLSVVMFLQFFIWGSWYLSVSLYMIHHQMEPGCYYAYTAGPLAAIITPVLMGLLVDRFFNSEKVLGALFALGGVFMVLLPWVGNLPGTPMEGVDKAFTVQFMGQTVSKSLVFNVLVFLHMLCYMPTLGLTASLSFFHMPKGATQFPLIRLWGTIGWIVAGFVLAFVFTNKAANIEGAHSDVQFYMGGGAGILLGLFCAFGLPATPAPKKGQPLDVRALLFMDAWQQMKSRSFAVFIICSFLVCIPLAAYYASLQQQMEAMQMPRITAMKNIGTFIEAGMMFAMPFFLRSLGVKKMIGIGILAWVVRYICFALGADTTPTAHALVIFGIALHGFCYDFFFVTGQIYVDNSTPANVRGQCQGMNILFTQGIGLYLGAIIAGQFAKHAFAGVASQAVPEALPHWPALWWPLAGIAAVVLVVFMLLFKDEGKIHAAEQPVG